MNLASAATPLVPAAQSEAAELLCNLRERLQAGVPAAQLRGGLSQEIEDRSGLGIALRDHSFASYQAAAREHDRLLDLLSQAQRRFEAERNLWVLLEPLTQAD